MNCLVNSVNERDLCLLTSNANPTVKKSWFFHFFCICSNVGARGVGGSVVEMAIWYDLNGLNCLGHIEFHGSLLVGLSSILLRGTTSQYHRVEV